MKKASKDKTEKAKEIDPTQETTNTLGERLRIVRQERDLSQRAIAGALGIRQSTYSGLERDENIGKSLDQLAAIAKFLNVSTDYLLGIDDRMQREKTLAGLTPMEQEMVSRLRRLGMERRRTLLNIARDLEEEESRLRRYRELVAEIEKVDTMGLLERSLNRLYELAAELGSMRAAVKALVAELEHEGIHLEAAKEGE